MARTASARKEPAGAGHNSQLSDEDRHSLLRMNMREARAIAEAEAAIKARKANFRKLVKTELGEHGMDQIKVTLVMEDPEKEKKVTAKQAAISQAIRFKSGENGQFDMFDGQPKSTETKAYHRGKLDALDGYPRQSPYGPGTADDEDYTNGFSCGSKVVDKILNDRQERAELIEGPARDKGGDLDEDGE